MKYSNQWIINAAEQVGIFEYEVKTIWSHDSYGVMASSCGLKKRKKPKSFKTECKTLN